MFASPHIYFSRALHFSLSNSLPSFFTPSFTSLLPPFLPPSITTHSLPLFGCRRQAATNGGGSGGLQPHAAEWRALCAEGTGTGNTRSRVGLRFGMWGGGGHEVNGLVGGWGGGDVLVALHLPLATALQHKLHTHTHTYTLSRPTCCSPQLFSSPLDATAGARADAD